MPMFNCRLAPTALPAQNESDMDGTLSSSEQSQLSQTIEMFEVITQTQPLDYQSLEILKEAYSKLDRAEDVIRTARRIAQAYVKLGQLSSAILEYESILQRQPEDPEVLQALAEIENAALSLDVAPQAAPEPEPVQPTPAAARKSPDVEVEDGRQTMFKLFVESKAITSGDFELCWPAPLPSAGNEVVEPFIQSLADRGTLLLDKSLRILCEKSRLPLLPLDKYDIDYELARTFPAQVCRRWCVLPFDQMSKSVLVATANPHNPQAARELEAATKARLIYYLAAPQDIIKGLKKAFR